VSALEWLLWLTAVWAVFFLFALFDVPTLVGRAAHHMRQQQLPHRARHGHVQPDDDPVPQHGRHRAN
jgi:hypothetical protein